VAADLTAQGIAKGESIAVMYPNGYDGVKALFSALYGGFRVTMLNLAAGPDALGYAMDHSEARVAFVHETQLDVFNQVKPERLNIYASTDQRAQLHSVSSQDDALLMYTSGTTGRPKGVVHTQSSLLAGGWTVSVAHELTENDRGMGVSYQRPMRICHWQFGVRWIIGHGITVFGKQILAAGGKWWDHVVFRGSNNH